MKAVPPPDLIAGGRHPGNLPFQEAPASPGGFGDGNAWNHTLRDTCGEGQSMLQSRVGGREPGLEKRGHPELRLLEKIN